jgi:polyhydroxyalkanoate synthesis regulator phasin
LGLALKNVGGEGGVALDKLIKQSEELQDKGIFSDDSIQKAQTQLANYGMSSDMIKELIPQIADLAAANGIGLTEATDLAIKAINGQTKGLKVLGADFVDTGNKADNLALLTDKLTKFQGANAAQLDTVAGKTERLANAWDDFKENVGEFLVNQGSLWLDFFDILKGKITLAGLALRDINAGVLEAGNEATSKFLSSLTGSIEEQTKAIDEQIKTRKENATRATKDYEAGRLDALAYQATIKSLVQQVKDLEEAKKNTQHSHHSWKRGEA